MYCWINFVVVCVSTNQLTFKSPLEAQIKYYSLYKSRTSCPLPTSSGGLRLCFRVKTSPGVFRETYRKVIQQCFSTGQLQWNPAVHDRRAEPPAAGLKRTWSNQSRTGSDPAWQLSGHSLITGLLLSLAADSPARLLAHVSRGESVDVQQTLNPLLAEGEKTQHVS